MLPDVTRRNCQLFLRLLQIASSELHLAACLGARLGFGSSRLTGMKCFRASSMWYWLQTRPQDMRCMRVLVVQDLYCPTLHAQYDNPIIMQFMLGSPQDVDDTVAAP